MKCMFQCFGCFCKSTVRNTKYMCYTGTLTAGDHLYGDRWWRHLFLSCVILHRNQLAFTVKHFKTNPNQGWLQ